ncbi:hypothetical protein [Clostridium butyricum]
MADALTSAASILASAWTFISGNEVLFGMCCVGLLSSAVYTVKSFF